MGSFTRSLVRTARRERERDEAHFPRQEPCHDCAFRPGSPEREDPKVWEALLAQADPANGIQPFHCHFAHDGTEMPVDDEGNYTPKRAKDGRPVGFPMCAGWAQTFNVKCDRLHSQEGASRG